MKCSISIPFCGYSTHFKMLKHQILDLLVFLFLGMFLPTFSSFAQSPSTCKQARLVVETIQQYHYAPRELDTDFTQLVVYKLLENLDDNGLLFTEKAAQEVQTAAATLVEDISKERCVFLDKVVAIYERQLKQKEQQIKTFQTQTWEINRKDVYQRSEVITYLNATDLANKQQQILHANILMDYLSPSDSTIDVSVLDEARFAKVKNNVLTRELCEIDQIRSHPNDLSGYIGDVYLNAITHAFDPHTNYFSLAQQQHFSEMLSDESYSFGFELAQKVIKNRAYNRIFHYRNDLNIKTLVKVILKQL